MQIDKHLKFSYNAQLFNMESSNKIQIYVLKVKKSTWRTLSKDMLEGDFNKECKVVRYQYGN